MEKNKRRTSLSHYTQKKIQEKEKAYSPLEEHFVQTKLYLSCF